MHNEIPFIKDYQKIHSGQGKHLIHFVYGLNNR